MDEKKMALEEGILETERRLHADCNWRDELVMWMRQHEERILADDPGLFEELSALGLVDTDEEEQPKKPKYTFTETEYRGF